MDVLLLSCTCQRLISQSVLPQRCKEVSNLTENSPDKRIWLLTHAIYLVKVGKKVIQSRIRYSTFEKKMGFQKKALLRFHSADPTVYLFKPSLKRIPCPDLEFISEIKVQLRAQHDSKRSERRQRKLCI